MLNVDLLMHVTVKKLNVGLYCV